MSRGRRQEGVWTGIETKQLIHPKRQTRINLTRDTANSPSTWSGELFRVVVDQSPDAVFLVDQSGLIVFANEQAERMFGYSASELQGAEVDMLVPDSVRPRHRALREKYHAAPVRRPMAEGKDLMGRHKSGRELPIVLALSPCSWGNEPHVLATVRDDSVNRNARLALEKSEAQLLRANEALIEREEHLSNLVKSIPDAVLTVDNEGLIEQVNPAAAFMLGRAADALIGSKIESLFSPEVARAINIDRRRTEGLDFLKGAALSADVLRGNGEDFRAAITINGFKAGGAHRYLWVIRDISNELRHEKERQSLMRALEEKNRELESIIYAASHDLRSPLVNLQGFSDELGKSCARLAKLVAGMDAPGSIDEARRIVVEEVPEALGFIESSTRKMDQLISGLLRLSRLGTTELQLRKLDMNKLVGEVVRTQQYTIDQAGAKVTVEALPECHGDAGQLSQVFSNLLDNAIKYRDPARQCEVRISGQAKSRDSIYLVEDNGPGIQQAHREKAFEVFHRLHPSGGVAGEGLGLAIVRRILDRHNGSVRLETGTEGGCRFVIVIPASRLMQIKNGTQRVFHAGVDQLGEAK